jgi:hypothetical protein
MSLTPAQTLAVHVQGVLTMVMKDQIEIKYGHFKAAAQFLQHAYFDKYVDTMCFH